MSLLNIFKHSLLSNDILLKLNKSKRFIFIFHDISDQHEAHHSELYSTPISTFIDQINFFYHKFRLISLPELLHNDELSDKYHYASITFDDGFHSVLKTAYPILKSKTIPFSIFLNKDAVQLNQLWVSNLILKKGDKSFFLNIYSNLINKEKISFDDFINNPVKILMKEVNNYSLLNSIYENSKVKLKIYLDENDVKYLRLNNVLIANHSKSHFVLSSCNQQIIEKEIKENKEYLESLTNQTIDYFASPFGKKEYHNQYVIDITKSTGHKYLFSSNPMWINNRNNFIIPRIGITNEHPKIINYYINKSLLKKIDL